jgi:hypothetical protein
MILDWSPERRLRRRKVETRSGKRWREKERDEILNAYIRVWKKMGWY